MRRSRSGRPRRSATWPSGVSRTEQFERRRHQGRGANIEQGNDAVSHGSPVARVDVSRVTAARKARRIKTRLIERFRYLRRDSETEGVSDASRPAAAEPTRAAAGPGARAVPAPGRFGSHPGLRLLQFRCLGLHQLQADAVEYRQQRLDLQRRGGDHRHRGCSRRRRHDDLRCRHRRRQRGAAALTAGAGAGTGAGAGAGSIGVMTVAGDAGGSTGAAGAAGAAAGASACARSSTVAATASTAVSGRSSAASASSNSASSA
jgi:hypothetical protein